MELFRTGRSRSVVKISSALLLVFGVVGLNCLPTFAGEENIPEGADREAWTLLKSAHDSRQVLPDDFKGFDAKLNLTVNDKSYDGTIKFRNKKNGTKIDLTGPDKEDMDWLKDKLISMIGHRRGGDFSKRDGRHKITFAKKDKTNWQGTLVKLNDRLKSSYRIRNKKVMEVTRSVGKTTFTISVIQTKEADPGKYLAHHFLVTYRDTKSGAIKQVDGFRDKYKKIAGCWLPLKRTVITIEPENKTPKIRRIKLTELKLVTN